MRKSLQVAICGAGTAGIACERMSKLLTPLFQSNLPAWVRDPLFIVGNHLPGVDKLMAASLRT